MLGVLPFLAFVALTLFEETQMRLVRYGEPGKEKPGILEVAGSERTITVKWDPSKLDEAAVRKILTDSGHPVK